jgi:hypothetical protein
MPEPIPDFSEEGERHDVVQYPRHRCLHMQRPSGWGGMRLPAGLSGGAAGEVPDGGRRVSA